MSISLSVSIGFPIQSPSTSPISPKSGYCSLLSIGNVHTRSTQTSLYSSPLRYIQTCYHQRMQVGNVFGHVCLCVCLSVCVCVCLCVCLCVQVITFEPHDIGTLFWVYRYILTISKSSLSIKVIGSNDNFTYFNLLMLCMWLHVIKKVKVTHQGEGHIKVKVKISSSLLILCKILLISTY